MTQVQLTLDKKVPVQNQVEENLGSTCAVNAAGLRRVTSLSVGVVVME